MAERARSSRVAKGVRQKTNVGCMRKAANSTVCRAITRSPRSLRAYIDAAGIVEDRKGWLFRTARGHNGSTLSDKPMSAGNGGA